MLRLKGCIVITSYVSIVYSYISVLCMIDMYIEKSAQYQGIPNSI